MAPHGLILRMHEATACADLLGILFSQYRQIFNTFLIKIMDFPIWGASRPPTVAPKSKTTWPYISWVQIL